MELKNIRKEAFSLPEYYSEEEKKRVCLFLAASKRHAELVESCSEEIRLFDEKFKEEDTMAIRADQRAQNQAEAKDSSYTSEETVIEVDEAYVRVALRDGKLRLDRQAFQAGNYSNLLKMRLSTGGFFVDMTKADFLVVFDYIFE
jgi:hypothetical protein